MKVKAIERKTLSDLEHSVNEFINEKIKFAERHIINIHYEYCNEEYYPYTVIIQYQDTSLPLSVAKELNNDDKC